MAKYTLNLYITINSNNENFPCRSKIQEFSSGNYKWKVVLRVTLIKYGISIGIQLKTCWLHVVPIEQYEFGF